MGSGFSKSTPASRNKSNGYLEQPPLKKSRYWPNSASPPDKTRLLNAIAADSPCWFVDVGFFPDEMIAYVKENQLSPTQITMVEA